MESLTPDEEYQKITHPLREEIIALIKSRLSDFPKGSFVLALGYQFYLAALDTMLDEGHIDDLKQEIELMRSELVKIENRIP